MPDQPRQPPKRRFSDRSESDWRDALNWKIDLFADQLHALEAEHHQDVQGIRADMRQAAEETNTRLGDVRGDLRRLDSRLDKFQTANLEQHRNIAYGKDPEDEKKPLPPQPATLTWGAVLKILTLFGVFFTAVSTIVAAVLAVLGAQ